MRKINWIKVLKSLIVPSILIFVLVSYFVSNKFINNEYVKSVEINIDTEGKGHFLTKEDLMGLVTKNFSEPLTEKQIKNLHIASVEKVLKTNGFIKKAEVSLSLDGVVMINIVQRNPIARVIQDNYKNQYYLDAEGFSFPIIYSHTEKIPIFTLENKVFKDNKERLSFNKLIGYTAYSLSNDSFMNSLCGQVEINQDNEFTIIPRLGNFNIELGDTSELGDKINRIKIFYERTIPQFGWDSYKSINLKYKKQIVATKNSIIEKEKI